MQDVESASQHFSDNEHFKEGDKASSPRQACTKDNQARYKKYQYSNVHFDYKKIGNDEKKLWHIKPCTLCGLNNHATTKSLKTMALYRKVTVMTKKSSDEDPSPHQERKKGKKTWRKKGYCNHCNKGGHKEATCWTLHLEMCTKKDKRVVKEPSNEAAHEAGQLQEEGQLHK